jgi:hypothetical protein
VTITHPWEGCLPSLLDIAEVQQYGGHPRGVVVQRVVVGTVLLAYGVPAKKKKQVKAVRGERVPTACERVNQMRVCIQDKQHPAVAGVSAVGGANPQ